jgi:tagatose-6-phosphate ketose/aldose isomerase
LDEMTNVGATTRSEILQQPQLWADTIIRAERFGFDARDLELPLIITGAGTSAYAAAAVAAALPNARAVPTTDLLTDYERYFDAPGILISLARSGDSPESVAVVEKINRFRPAVKQYAITCNAAGRLARHPAVHTLLLDPRANDQSLVMTSSFSNLALAGSALRRLPELASALPQINYDADRKFAALEAAAQRIAARGFSRAVILASASLIGAAREAALKILEMTAGQIPVLAETFLGLRHGPMSFLREDTLVLCFLSASPATRRYEYDLLAEIGAKKIGYIVAIAPADDLDLVPDEQQIPALAPDLPDALRTPFEIVFAQLLALRLSLDAGLDPDNPSAAGIINRVVQGFRIYE